MRWLSSITKLRLLAYFLLAQGLRAYLEQMTKVPKVSEAEKQINRLMETGA